MKIEINIEKKHLYILTTITLLLISLTVFAVQSFDPTKPWHPLQQITTDETGTASVDDDENSVIDNADKLDNLDSSQFCKSDGTNCPPDGTGTDDQTLSEVLTQGNDADGYRIENLGNPDSGDDALNVNYADGRYCTSIGTNCPPDTVDDPIASCSNVNSCTITAEDVACSGCVDSGDIGSIGACNNICTDANTRCDTSGICSQVCIGSDCQSSWPSYVQMKTGQYIGNRVDGRNVNIGVNLLDATWKWLLIKSADSYAAQHKFGHNTEELSARFDMYPQQADNIQAWTATGFEIGWDINVNGDGFVYNYVVFWVE